MNDDITTISQLKAAVIKMVKQKGWGDKDGIQNPQHVAMAMTVEMAELLEHFQWLNDADVERLKNGQDAEKTSLIAEEFADVMMYGLQLMRTLNIDVSHEIERKIEIVLKRPENYKQGEKR